MKGKNVFEKYGKELSGVLTPEDLENYDILLSTTYLAIRQENSDTEQGKIGWFYSNTGIVPASEELIFTPVRKELDGSELRTPFGQLNPHKICDSSDQVTGFPYTKTQDGSWVRSNNGRNCQQCPHNPFRYNSFNTIASIEGVPNSLKCKGNRVLLVLIHASESSPISEAIPCVVQFSSWVRSVGYRKIPESWDAVRLELKRADIPPHFMRFKMWTQKVQTGPKKSYIPLFQVLKPALDMSNATKSAEELRKIIGVQTPQLMLHQAASVAESQQEALEGGTHPYEYIEAPAYSGAPPVAFDVGAEAENIEEGEIPF